MEVEMIDFRHVTFYHLCQIRNFTKTAEYLHMTQPAVTQHIKYLEELYKGKLFRYHLKVLTLTDKGKKLYTYTQRMIADSEQIKNKIMDDDPLIKLTFGTTLTIGEFIMPTILNKFMHERKDLYLNMLVENTQSLLLKLERGEINFAMVEGHFDKSQYGYKLFKNERFIGITSTHSKLKGQTLCLENLLESRLILRESGSGTRSIFEQILIEKNLNKNSFKSVIEIGSLNVIKDLVKHDHGITFMYESAVKQELLNGELHKLEISDFNVTREFNLVFLKDSIFTREYLQVFDLFKME
jgi:LysR family transcriptional regulator, transcriptional activator of the cysJI operon